jgi:hypothetical protein
MNSHRLKIDSLSPGVRSAFSRFGGRNAQVAATGDKTMGLLLDGGQLSARRNNVHNDVPARK